jgi:hypothetical protein
MMTTMVENRATRRLAVAAVAALSLLALAAGSVWAAPTEAQLRGAILGAGEVGSGFTVEREGPTPGAMPAANYVATYTRESGDIVTVALFDRSGFDLATVASELTNAVSLFGVDTAAIDAPALGTNARAFRLNSRVADQTVHGNVLVWQQGDVIAAVVAMSSQPVDGIAIAQRQQSKLSATFGT